MHQAVAVNFIERLLCYKIYRNSAFLEVCGAVKDGVPARRQRGEEEMGVPAHTCLPPLSPCRPRAQLQALRWLRRVQPAPHCLVRGQGGQLWGFAHSEPGVGVGGVRVVESLARQGKKALLLLSREGPGSVNKLGPCPEATLSFLFFYCVGFNLFTQICLCSVLSKVFK